MNKAALIALYGGVRKTARAMGVDDSTINKWPDGELTEGQADRAIGAAIRTKGLRIAKAHFPRFFEEAADNE